VSAFDLFKVGIGPSSSHTVGPMRAACSFATALEKDGLLEQVRAVRAELFGSLGATGHGHGSVKAVVLGLQGEVPDEVDPVAAEPAVRAVRERGRLALLGRHVIDFAVDDDVVLHRRKRLEFHSNGMRFRALDADGNDLSRREYYSVGGGFVLDESEIGEKRLVPDSTPVRYPFTTGEELLVQCRESGLPISEVMLANELSWRSEEEVRAGLLRIWSVMQECVTRGCATGGVLPGGLKVRRRAAQLSAALEDRADAEDPLRAMDWVTLFALAVNEENAAEIGIEHNLGLTCDPVGGLVQIPCIERNAVASVKAIAAARMAIRGDGQHHVSLDKAIKTLRETGADMTDKYKETARGGLALNVVEC
jgi:L-serine dehydratase